MNTCGVGWGGTKEVLHVCGSTKINVYVCVCVWGREQGINIIVCIIVDHLIK